MNAADIISRLLTLLPLRWFADNPSVLQLLLAGAADCWCWIQTQLAYAQVQTRIATATDSFLDLISQDFLGDAVPRRFGESDDAFRPRVQREILRDRATRPALISVLTDLTGRAPTIFEPAHPADTGAWSMAMGYGLAGGWGSLTLPFQFFVTAFRPQGTGVPNVAGYGTSAGSWGGGPIEYASLAMAQSQVSDDDINAVIARTVPVATTAWTRISN